jgi:hypothetical protein
MDFIFGLPEDDNKNNGILVLVDRFSKMVHLVAVPETITAEGCARVFVDTVFRLHGLPRDLVSDRDPRFTAEFWRAVFRLLGTRVNMSTSDHPESDGQTERANRVIEEILRGYVHSFSSWSEFLPMVEFAINNSVHASTTHTPFYVNGLRHPRIPALLESESSLREGGNRSSEPPIGSRSSDLDGSVEITAVDHPASSAMPDGDDDEGDDDEYDDGDDAVDDSIVDDDDDSKSDDALAEEDMDISAVRASRRRSSMRSRLARRVRFVDEEDMRVSAVRASRTAVQQTASAEDFLLTRQAVVRFVQDSIAHSVDRQKHNADRNGRANILSFEEGDLVLLSTTTLPTHAVTNVGSSKLLPKYIGPFRVLRRMGNAYTLELPRRMRTHPTFYVGRLRPYHQFDSSCEESEPERGQGTPAVPCSQPSAALADPERRQASTQPSEGDAPARPAPSSPPARWRAASPAQPGVGESPHDGHLSVHRSPAQNPAQEEQSVFPPPPPPLRDSTGAVRWVVERLLNHHDQRDGNRTKYLVRWRGYPPSADSWEPRENLLEDVPGLVAQYDEAHPLAAVPSRRQSRRGTRRVAHGP